MDLIILYGLLLMGTLPVLTNCLFCQLFKHFLRGEIKLVAELYPHLPISLFKDRHCLSLHKSFKTLPANQLLSNTRAVSKISS